MRRGLFVTGTDTGVGKTFASCALLHALRSRGEAPLPMKPIAAGAELREGRWTHDDTERLMEAAGLEAPWASRVTPTLLRAAMAPHIAAVREGIALGLEPVLAAFESLRAEGRFLVVEGVGGFRVPLADGLDTVDLARTLDLPVVIVVGMRLGCLNHALLTRDAVAAAGLPLAGWIANTIDPDMDGFEDNVEALESRIEAPLLGVLPHGVPAPKAAAHLDVALLP